MNAKSWVGMLMLAVAPLSYADALAASPPPAPIPADAGLAVAVSGSVTYKATGVTAATAVTPYMKLRVGDAVDVGSDGRLEILYFGSGRREVWTSGSALRVGASGSEAVKGAAQATEAGSSVGRSLESLPIMLRQAQTYQAGQVLVRGTPKVTTSVPLDDVETAQVAEARALYTEMRKTAAPTDVFPEMYLASVLLPLGLDVEAAETLETATKACPTCEEPKLLLEWVHSRTKK